MLTQIPPERSDCSNFVDPILVRISGFSFVRNANLYDFPLRESIASLLPLCDEIVIAVGASDDGTLDAVKEIGSPKIRVIETVWDESLRKGGGVYAQQTDLALAGCTGDWCIYLQADEVLHQDDYDLCRRQIARAVNDTSVDALLFRYLHFYGSYNYIGAGRSWYRREVRAFRNTGNVISWGDAQGFRKRTPDGSTALLRARQTDVRAFHYGWVRKPEIQGRKHESADRFWHDDEWIARNSTNYDLFDYASVYELKPFIGTHPVLMQPRIEQAQPWARLFDPSRTQPKPCAMKLTDWVEHRTGWRIGEYRNFIEVP